MTNQTVKVNEVILEIENLAFEGVDLRDRPDFCDAFVASANVKEQGKDWRDATDEELDSINEDSSFVSENLHSSLY